MTDKAKSRSYTVEVAVEGYYYMQVTASDPDEAIAKAHDDLFDPDIVDVTENVEIDWPTARVTEEQ